MEKVYQIFATQIDATIFYVVYLSWALSEIIGAGILPKLRQRKGGNVVSSSDRGSRGAIFLGVFVSILIGFAFAESETALFPSSLISLFFSIGIFLMLLGIAIRQWAIVTLGRFFSLSVRVTFGQKVVNNGPYRLVRHPSYTGAFLSFTGLGFALGSWGAILVIFLMFGVVYGYRIRVEENTLKANLGDDYAAYMKRTKRLIPYLI